MKALVCTGGRGLEVREVPAPEPAEGQVRLRITNCGICGSDLFLYRTGAMPAGTIMGHELSGVADKLGAGVEGVKEGDRIIARPAGCGECKFCRVGAENICAKRRAIGFGQIPGGFAEYMVADRDMILPAPEGLGLDQASMADQFGSALHGIRTIGFRAGETALVTGAGPIGLCAVMLLDYLGARTLAAAEVIPGRRELAAEFGADHVIDPAAGPLAAALAKVFGPEGVDCVIECSGAADAIKSVIQAAPMGCRISMVGMGTKPVSFIPFVMFQKHLTLIGSFGNTQAECVESMEIMASGKIPSARLITGRISMEEVPAAFEELLESKDQLKVMMEL